MASTQAVDTGTDYGNAGPIPLSSPSVSAGISPEPQPESSGFPGTTPTPISTPTPAPAAPGAAYNPLSAQPYAPPTASPVQPIPQAQPLGPDQQAPGAANHAGAAAYLGDQILRGFMQGRAQSQMIQAVKLQKQSSGLQKNLDMASQQYYNLARAGTDPNSPEMQSAKSQVDAAFQANMDFMKQHIAGQQIDKKTGQIKPQQGNILQRLTNRDDPAAQSLAVYQGAQALGPPVYHQAAPFLTPQYQAYAKTQAQTAGETGQTGLATAQLAHTTAQQEIDYNSLLNKQNRSPEEDQQLDALARTLGKPGSGLQIAVDQEARNIETLRQSGQISQEEANRRLVQLKSTRGLPVAPPPRMGSEGAELQNLFTANGHKADGSDVSPEDYAAATRYVHAQHAAAPVTTSGQKWLTVQGADGQQHQIAVPQTSTRSTSQFPLPRGWVGTESGGQNSPVPAGVPPVAANAAVATHQQALSEGNTPLQAAARARAVANNVKQSYYGSARILTDIPTGAPDKLLKDEQTARDNNLNAQATLQNAEQAAANPTPVGDLGLITAWTKAHVGRVTNNEINMANKVGGAKLAWENGEARIVDGQLSPQQRQMFMQSIRENASTWQHQVGLYDQARQQRGSVVGGGGTIAGAGHAAAAAPPANGQVDPAVAAILQKLGQLK